MADLLIVGSFAFDTINTQTARREKVLGGTGSHASYGASFYTKVFASGRVGGADWKDEYSETFKAHNINIENLQIVPGEETTAWEGTYEADMNNRSTVYFRPNCCVEFHPNLNEDARKCPFIFLATNSPASQMEVIDSAINPRLIVADTMDYYINGFRSELDEVLKKIDGLILNDSEARLLTGKSDLFDCADEILTMGPRFVIIKKGAHGSLFRGKDGNVCVFPAYPSRNVVEPTGAGDCFAGSFMGYLASQEKCDFETIKKAMIYATVTASFTIEDFSFDALKRSTRTDIDRRFEEMREMLSF